MHIDTRKLKVNKFTVPLIPDGRLRKIKLDFQEANFWYLKGYDHAEKTEMDSAIDSYRQCIRLDSKHAGAMVNLAA